MLLESHINQNFFYEQNFQFTSDVQGKVPTMSEVQISNTHNLSVFKEMHKHTVRQLGQWSHLEKYVSLPVMLMTKLRHQQVLSSVRREH